MARATRYCPRKSENSDVSDKERVIPPNAPYLTKVNGKLVFARQKTPKAADIAIDLLGESFGATVIRKRSKSLERTTKIPLLIAGSQYVPQPQLTYSEPQTVQLQQQAFAQPGASMPMVQYPYPSPNPQIYASNTLPMAQFQPPYSPQYFQPAPQQCLHCVHLAPQHPGHCNQPEPQHYTAPPSKPTEKDFEVLQRINAHYNEVNSEKKSKRLSVGSSGSSTEIVVQDQSMKTDKIQLGIDVSKTTITITKHVCASCRRIRSSGYHKKHPIKAGETPGPAFCGRCQRNASSTGGSDTDRGASEKQQKVKEKKEKKQPRPAEYTIEEEESPQDAHRRYTRLRTIESDVERLPPSPRTVNENWKPESRLADEKAQMPKRRERAPAFSTDDIKMYEQGAALQALHDDRNSIPQDFGCRENGFNSASSLQSFESRRRRRVERAHTDVAPVAPWDAPHVIHPQPGDEAVAITERWVYRPKKQTEEQRRQQESLERASYKDKAAQAAEEASRYYHDSWKNDEKASFREQQVPRESRRGRYRRDENIDLGSAESGSSDYIIAESAVFHDIPSRSQNTPPPPEAWPEEPRYRRSSDEQGYENTRSIRAARKDKAPRKRSPERFQRDSRRRDRSTSTATSYRYVQPPSREHSHGRTEIKPAPSPPSSHQRFPSYNDGEFFAGTRDSFEIEGAVVVSPKKGQSRSIYHEDKSSSDITERERIAERDAKRVTFRSPSASPSVESVRSGYDRSGYKSDSAESLLRRKISWDDSDLRGPVRPSRK